MKLEFLNKEDDTTILILKETNPTEANMLRRTIMEEVPTLAIEDVNFVQNGSALYDEMVAHRLGLVALKTDLKSYDLPTECKGKKKGESTCTKENCPHHTVIFQLKINGPKLVYAEDLKCKDPKITPVHPKSLIVKLLKKQSLEFDATAIMGQGKDHSKFSPGLVYYRGYPIIKIKDVKNPEAIKEICPSKVYEVKNGKLKITDEKKCMLCKACVDASKKNITVKGSDEEFIFHIEPWGQLTPKEMLLKAIEIMDSKLDNLTKLVKKV